MKTKVYKVEIMVIDFDDLGVQGVIDTIEHTRYPNHCMSPQVMGIASRDVEWADDHPLNFKSKQEAEFVRMFNLEE